MGFFGKPKAATRPAIISDSFDSASSRNAIPPSSPPSTTLRTPSSLPDSSPMNASYHVGRAQKTCIPKPVKERSPLKTSMLPESEDELSPPPKRPFAPSAIASSSKHGSEMDTYVENSDRMEIEEASDGSPVLLVSPYHSCTFRVWMFLPFRVAVSRRRNRLTSPIVTANETEGYLCRV